MHARPTELPPTTSLAQIKCRKKVTLTFLVFATLLLSACGAMKQSSLPSSSTSAKNSLASSVNIIQINAKTLPQILSKDSVLREADSEPTPSTSNWQYRIGPGDVLSIVVWDHPQLTIPAGPQRTPQEAGNWVGPNGTIFYPYIGTLDVSGKSIEEVRLAVADGLRSVIPNPQVDVSIARFGSQKVQITGAVGKPGSLPITNIPINLADAIESREGVLPDGNLRQIKLIRENAEYSIDLKKYLDSGDQKNNPQLLGADVVVVPKLESNEVYVLGEVNKPKVVPIGNQPLSLTAALAFSDGLNKKSANAKGIFVFRTNVDQQEISVYQLDITDPAALLLGTRFRLNKGDVVYATSASAARWNRVISNIIPSLGFVNTLLLLDDRT